jgi:hypothetical protein
MPSYRQTKPEDMGAYNLPSLITKKLLRVMIIILYFSYTNKYSYQMIENEEIGKNEAFSGKIRR